MPNCPGRKDWPGDRHIVRFDETLGRAIVRIAGELGVSANDWAYSAIIAESLPFRKTPVISPKKIPGEEPVLLRLPAKAARRIAEADELARSLGLSLTVTGLLLGDLADCPANLGEVITENYEDLDEEELAAVQQAVERWKAEDALIQKGGAA